jgi:hypothetical protein
MTISLDQLTGSWKLMCAWHEFDTRQRRYPYGSDAVGSLVFTDDNRIISIIIAGRSVRFILAFRSQPRCSGLVSVIDSSSDFRPAIE